MRKSKILALTMSAVLIAGTMFTGCSSDKDSNKKESNSNVDYGLTENIEDGAILQCFCWSFNTISDSMEDIARAGYSAIQTSPANECIVGGRMHPIR